MQLNSIGNEFEKITKATTQFNAVIEAGTGSNIIYKNILQGLSEQEKINIVARATLTKEEQIGALASAGVSAENIKTAIAANKLSGSMIKLSASESTVIGTSSSLKLAIKGVGSEIKKLLSYMQIFIGAHPALLPILGTIVAIGAAITSIDLVQKWADGTTAVNKYNQELEKSEQMIKDNNSALSEYQPEIEANKSKVQYFT